MRKYGTRVSSPSHTAHMRTCAPGRASNTVDALWATSGARGVYLESKEIQKAFCRLSEKHGREKNNSETPSQSLRSTQASEHD